jgi:exo-1,4-beta-D-glucosaminidase
MKLSVLLLAPLAFAQAPLELRDGWAIQSSAFVRETGDALSAAGYKTRGWYPATVPSTVLNALVENRVYPDPYSGMNLRAISGASYPIAANFSNIEMPPDSPFRNSWWYRTEFQVPEDYRGKTVWLRFAGINFRASVWMNGKRVASADRMAGAWRTFEYDVTQAAAPGRANALAVEVFPPQPGDLAITFVDWNPMPPDKVMGIWRGVTLAATGPVAIRFPNVVSKLSGDRANLSVTAEVVNSSAQPVNGTLKGQIENLQFSEPVRLAANETRVVRFAPRALANPRLWWPAQVGEQNLYPLDLQFEIDGQPSDRAYIRFGVREITSSIDERGHRLFRINGKNILIRGAGYTFDMLLRSSPERQEAELRYVRDMNLNAVRLEGKLEDDHFLDLCDRLGILVLAGWCCCDNWEHWRDWDDEDRTIAAESLRDQSGACAATPRSPIG